MDSFLEISFVIALIAFIIFMIWVAIKSEDYASELQEICQSKNGILVTTASENLICVSKNHLIDLNIPD